MEGGVGWGVVGEEGGEVVVGRVEGRVYLEDLIRVFCD